MITLIGKRIRYQRKRNGLTLEQLSEGICSVSYLSKIEHGDKSSVEVSRLLCERLNINYNEQAHGEQIEKIDQELSDWYQQMITSSDPKMEDLSSVKDHLAAKVSLIQEPLVSLKFDLISLYFYTMLETNDLASQLIKQLNLFKEMFTTELRYSYALFCGIYFCNTSQLDKASEHLYLAESMQNQIPLTDQDLAELSYQIARLEGLKYHVPKCIQYATQALSLFNQFYNLKRIADCQTLLGISHRRINNFVEAEHHYEQALKFVSILDNKQRIAILYHNLGFCYASQDNHKLAIDYLIKSIDIKQKIKSPTPSIIYSLTLLAEEYYRLENFEKAKAIIDQSLQMIEHRQDCVDYLKLKVIEYKLTHPIHPHYELLMRQSVIPRLSEKKRWEDVTNYAEELAEYYFNHHQYKMASLFYKKANEARKKLL